MKRCIDDGDVDAGPERTKHKRSKVVKAPIDGLCPVKDSYDVYADFDGTVLDASLSLSSIEGNNNKYYYIQLLAPKDPSAMYALWTHWGRVGETGQKKLDQDLVLETALSSFSKKFKDKTGLNWEKRYGAPKANKYTLIEKAYNDDPDDAVEETGITSEIEKSLEDQPSACMLSPELQDLVRFLFNPDNMKSAMASQNYNYNKLPLGKLSKTTIEKGYLALKDLGEVIQDPDAAKDKYHGTLKDVFSDLSSKYYTIIPHDFGRKRPAPINTEDLLKAEVDLVEMLGNMRISNEVLKETETSREGQSAVHPLDARMASLVLQEALALDEGSLEFGHLARYFRHADGDHSDATIRHIYRISRTEEVERFVRGGYDAEGMKTRPVKDCRKLLWHGSRGCNFGGILSQGLRIAPPEAPPNGKAFGNGVYLADRASKSASYCDPWNTDQTGLLLLCETQLGDPSYIRSDHESNAAVSMRQKGLISTKMMTDPMNDPAIWLDAAVFNADIQGACLPDPSIAMPQPHGFPNEYIVYDIAQVQIRYVFMLQWNTSRRWGIY